MIALTFAAGFVQANPPLLTETPGGGSAGGGVTLTCSTTAGPGAAVNIVLKPAGAIGASTYAVTYTNMAGFTITAPATTSITSSNATAGITYSIQANAGCTGVSGTLQFLVGGVNDVTVAITDTVTATAALVAPATLAISCTLNSGTYTPGPAQTVSVTSAASGGTPFTVDTTVANDPAWVTLNPTTPSGTAGTTAVTFTVAATPTGGSPGCGGFNVNTTHTFNLHLKSGVASTTPDVKILVTLSIVPPSPLIVTPVAPATSLSLSYVKSSGNAGTVSVNVTSPSVPGAYFNVNTSSFPNWLTVNYQAGNTTKALIFSTTNVSDSLALGTYSASITMSVSSYADLSVPFTLLVTNKPATLSVSPSTITIPWTLGSLTPPSATLTATSSDSPIAFSIVTGGTLLPIVNPAGPDQEANLSINQRTGLAYSFGTNIPITFNPSLFSTVTPGQQLTGTVTFTWGSPAAVIVVPVTINVQSPGATLTSIYPATLPLAAPGTSFTVTLTGTGFVGGSDPATKTRIGTVAGAGQGSISPDTNFSLVWISSTNMTLTITVPNTADPLLPFSPTGVSGVFGGSVYLGIVNGISSSVPTGTKTLTIGNGPLIQGITSSSSFTEVSGTTLPTIAPYDMISIFGANFCASGGTGCATGTILQNAPDSVYFRYPTTLSPDPVSATQRIVSVNFMPHGQTAPVWPAPLLFATNSQINALVPAGAIAGLGTVANNLGVDIVVTFGYTSAAPATLLKSNVFPVNIAATDPGVFTIGSDGQGPPAALNANWALIGPTNPAGMRTGVVNGPDSDTIQLYVTGLGAPTSAGDNTSAGDGTGALTNCIGAVTASGTGSYQATLGGGFTNIDGDVIQASLVNTNRFAPCLTTVPVVTIGGVPGTVTYAGFVENTVAGLYQINVQLPPTYTNGQPLHPDFPTNSAGAAITTLKTATQLPVFVTVGAGAPSQAGVMLSVIPRLLMTAPSNLTTLQVGHFWTGTVLAQEGTGNITFAVTSGALPSGLTLASTTGIISGIPGPNTNGNFTVTVTATDSASVPLTGSVAFTLSVAGGLYVTSTGVAPYNLTFGTASNSVTVVTALGGVYPYTYAINTPSTIPVGMTIPTTVSGQNSIGTLKTTAQTPAGIYQITITATDAVGTTGTLQFEVIVNLEMTFNPTTPVVVGATDTTTTIATVTASGGSSTSYTYSIDQTLNTGNALLLSIDPSLGVITNNGAVDNSPGGMTVYIDAVDNNPPNPNAASVAPGRAAITVVIQN
jgi:uncharacterized protein (TIGR03437 family)